jgi:hypothetical protein
VKSRISARACKETCLNWRKRWLLPYDDRCDAA